MRSFPDRGTDGDGLTPRQRRVLEVIRDSVERRGYPPSVREIGEAVGLRPASSASPTSCGAASGRASCAATRTAPARSTSGSPASDAAARAAGAAGGRGGRSGDAHAAPRPTCPLVGRIAAGGPILAEQAVEDVFPLPRELVGEGTLFLLKVVGDSMVDAAICDGDWVVVRQQPTAENGDIVAAMIDGEATVKTYQAPRRPRLADAAQPGLRADPRRRGHASSAGSSPCCAGSERRQRRVRRPAGSARATRPTPASAAAARARPAGDLRRSGPTTCRPRRCRRRPERPADRAVRRGRGAASGSGTT